METKIPSEPRWYDDCLPLQQTAIFIVISDLITEGVTKRFRQIIDAKGGRRSKRVMMLLLPP